MNPFDLGPFTENSDCKEQWVSRIKAAVEKAEHSANMCEAYETVYCSVNINFSKLCKLDFPKDASRCNEAGANLRQISMLFTKIKKLMKSMRFMRNMTSTNLEFVTSLVNFENITQSQLHEAIDIIELLERNDWLLGETISIVKTTISEYRKRVEEMIKMYSKIGSNEE
ncbi:uncharacterized protein TNCV_4761361 [Trichonephila clavipes]|uniref:Uncharacterized protein n=1 Tax=Trichonephila clavipes TaxID=2585209 RepID=A0A8X6V309_TRICX|nr:uncharacterized protein TNCV_4761361 [Trichonephila clavipes]